MWQALSGKTGFKSEIFKDRKSADNYIIKIRVLTQVVAYCDYLKNQEKGALDDI